MSEDLRQWLYHAEHEARIFDGPAAIEAALADDWKDSPAKCKGFLDKIGVDPDNKLQVQFIGDVAEQTAEVVNLVENLAVLDKTGILRLAELQFTEDWSKRRVGLEKLREAMSRRLDAENVILKE